MSIKNLNVPTGLNRREYERFSFPEKIKFHLFEDESYELSALDISAGGLGIIAPFNLPSNISCKVEVVIPISKGKLSFEAPVEVKHSIYRREEDGFILGVRFTEIRPCLQTAIVCLMRGKAVSKDAALDAIARLGRHSTQ